MEIIMPVVIVGIIGLIAGVGLSLASKFMSVPADEKQQKIRDALPGANCGACGYSGCDGYAAALAAGEAAPDKCAPGGAESAAKLSEILGVEVVSEPKTAFIACGGNREVTKLKYGYEGMLSCAAASLVSAGPLECEFGCIGFGDCAKACPFGAIAVDNGRPAVCGDLCVGCGKCVSACPKSLISLLPVSAKMRVACSSAEKGAAAARACAKACIACKMCEKVCESGAIKVSGNLARIDYSLCTSCGKCREVCKRGIIV